MSEILVVYASSEGQTAAIAERIANVLDDEGHGVTLVHAAHPPDALAVSAFDGVLVGASVHKGRHQSSIEAFVREHVDQLNRLPTAFVSVSLTAATPGPEKRVEAREQLQSVLEETGWDPERTQTVAGALAYSEYGLVTRFIMKRIAGREGLDTDTSRDHEYTDWEALDEFAREFAQLVS